MNPLVSVIVPCYNYARFVPATIRSLQAQNFQDWECIVVNDGSKDNSEEVVKKLAAEEPRIKYVYQENKGLPGARNTGIEHARGKYLQFLDADDLLQVRKLELQAKYLEEHEEVDLVYSDLRYFFDGEPDKLIYTAATFNRPWALNKSGNGEDLLQYLIISCVIMPPMPMIRKSSLLDKVGLFSRDLRSCEDWEFWLRCAAGKLNFYYLDEVDTLSLMRLHPSSMTRNRKVMIPSMIEVRNRIKKLTSEPKLLGLNRRFLLNDLAELAVEQQYNEGKMVGLRQLFSEAKAHKSLKLGVLTLVTALLPYKANLFLLSLIRSAEKKWKYLGS